MITFGGKNQKREPEIINVAEFIAKKGFRAKGKRATPFQVSAIEFIEPLDAQEAAAMENGSMNEEERPAAENTGAEVDYDDSPTLF